MKIVKFKDGRYAIRKRFLFWNSYLDLTYSGLHGLLWLDLESSWIDDCKTKDIQILIQKLDKGDCID